MSKWSQVWTRLRRRSGIAGHARFRILLWATIAGLIFGAIELGQPLEDGLRMARNRIRQHDASGDIVIVAVDEQSLQNVGEWPWARRRHAQLIDQLTARGARRIFFDIEFFDRSNAQEDRILEEALARRGNKVYLASRTHVERFSGQRTELLPLPSFRRHVGIFNINVRIDYRGWVWNIPYVYWSSGHAYPSMASTIAGVEGPVGSSFPIDYAINPRSIPTIRAADVLAGGLRSDRVDGKDVIVSLTSQTLGDIFFLPGYGQMGGSYVQALGAETLKAGRPLAVGWLLPFLVAAASAAVSMRSAKLRNSMTSFAAIMSILVVAPLGLEASSIFIDVVPALFLSLVIAICLTWSSLGRSYRTRGSVNPVSGLLNLDALRRERQGRKRILVAARIHNYAAIVSALPSKQEAALVEQVAKRLTLGRPDQTLYHGDEGIFAWFADQETAALVGEQLDALHGFFRNSLTVSNHPVDLVISFGIDADGHRSISNRLGSALVAADEAAGEGLRWKAYDPAKLKDASWKLSLLGQLDLAIDSGDLWVAYQPKLDLASMTICGAEALVRWTHPEKGPIEPIDFVLAAEQSDRIGKLTSFVVEEAVAAAAAINAEGPPFNIAVNLSTRLLDDQGFAARVSDVLYKHGLAPRHLTLEVTETAAIGGGPSNLQTLDSLRKLGVGISIDDYGTGLSTLEYLKKIPATEIKIDQSFIAAVTKSHSDRLMVHSTIQLVHSLGHKVVAEGVEDLATLDALTEMGCDYAQGYFISRPVTLQAVNDLLRLENRRLSAQNG